MSAIKKYIYPFFEEVNTNKLSPIIFRDFRNYLASFDLHSKTKNYILKTMKQILNHARLYFFLKEDYSVYLYSFPTTQSEKTAKKIMSFQCGITLHLIDF